MLTAKAEVSFLNIFDRNCDVEKEDQTISVEEALQNYYRQDIVFFDLRRAAEYEDYHIPGSFLLPIEELEMRYREIPKDKTVYLICRTGNRTTQGMRYLLTKGYNNVFSVLDGITAWEGPLEGKADFI